MLQQLVVAMAVVVMLAGAGVCGRSIARMENKPPRDLFDQMVHSIAAKYLRLPPGPQLQWSVHPLPRKRQLNLLPSAASSNGGGGGGGGDDDGGATPSLGGLFGGGGGNAIPATVLAAAASASSTASGSSASASSAAQPSATSATSERTASSATPSSASSATPSSVASSMSATPLSKLINTSSTASASSSSSTSSTSATPTSTSQPTAVPLLSPKHKMFPLVVAGLAAAGLLALMLLIAIARCIAHNQLRRDNLAKSYSFDDPASATTAASKSDKFTTAPPRRSIRRALTKKKQLGSFARRTQDGSVLIEVGDEVFAVPPHLADNYRQRILREKRSRSEMSIKQGGMWGNVEPKWLTDGGPDGDEEQARARYDDMLAGNGVGRSLSQRLGDKLRSLTSAPLPKMQETLETSAYSFGSQGQQSGAMRQVDLAKGGVVAGGPGWQIQQRQSSAQHTAQRLSSAPPASRPHPKQHTYGTATITDRSTVSVGKPTRKPAPKLELSLLTEKLADLEKQSSAASSTTSCHKLPSEARLTTASSSSCGTFGDSSHSQRSLPGTFPQRTKSLHRSKSVKPLLLDANVGAYRHRSPTSTHRAKTLHPHAPLKSQRTQSSVALASPTRFTHDTAVVAHPQTPQPAATLRPLPVPPPFNPK